MSTALPSPLSPTCESSTGTLPCRTQTPDIDWPRTPSPTHPSTSDSGDVPPGCISALNASLLHIVDDPLAISPSLMEKIALENNPRPLRELMQDNAQYWVTTDNQLLHIKFPAKVDRNGQYERIGPYFNMPSTGLDIPTLQKARAQFELVALDDEVDKSCPSTAIECSRAFFAALFAFFDEVESRQLPTGKNASVIPFWRTYEPGRGDHYSLIVTTDPLFVNLPRANKMAAPKITHADVGKSPILLSPSKACAATFAKANDDAAPTRVETGHNTPGPKILRINNLPDPHGRYAGLLKTYGGLTDAKLTTPDVRDTQGVLITPAEYDTRISDGDIVEVEVILKLWSIQPNPRGNPNGSRIYQTMLQSMKLLPYHSYSQRNILQVKSRTSSQPLPAADKGKRKADGTEILPGQSPTKKCEPMPRVSTAVEEMDISEGDE